MPASDINQIFPRVTWIIGARTNTWDTSIADDRFIEDEIFHSIVETESELVRDLCEAMHAQRTPFLAWSANLANESILPAHIGQVEKVQIKQNSGGSFVLAEKAERDDIRQWRENYNLIFDPTAHDQNGSQIPSVFNITNETITFTGSIAQVYVCQYSPDYATPALQIDDKFDNALVAGTVPKLFKLGVPAALVSHYAGLYTQARQSIRQGLMQMPDISAMQEAA